MATFPLTLPTSVLPPLRAHIAERLAAAHGLAAPSFDEAVAAWWRELAVEQDRSRVLPQQVCIGEFMRAFRSEQVHQFFCPNRALVPSLDWDLHSEGLKCRDYAAPAVHLGYASCAYVMACEHNNYLLDGVYDFRETDAARRRAQAPPKLTPTYVAVAREILQHGRCFAAALRGRLPADRSGAGSAEGCGGEHLVPHYAAMVYMQAAVVPRSDPELRPDLRVVHRMYADPLQRWW